jgi:hypothetical protein
VNGRLAPHLRQVGLYLRVLFGAESEGWIEVRFKRPGGMGRRFEPVPYASGFERQLVKLGQRTDVYVGVALRKEQSGTRDAIEWVYVVWCDCDSPDSIAALEAFEPQPSLVVASGSGQHAYWSLSAPTVPEAIERANRRLADWLGADLRATDAARILRPPGTLNHKSDPPRPVCIERFAHDVYTLGEVVGHLPDPPSPARERRRSSRRGQGEDEIVDALRAIEPADYIEALTGHVVGRDGKVRCPFHDDRTPSLHCYDTAGEGFYCFGCCRGGDIFSAGGLLWGLDPHSDFRELRDRLAAELLGAEVAS